MSRYRDPQLQATENVYDLRNLGHSNICVSRFKVYFTFVLVKHRMSTVVAISALGVADEW